ncbi:hypothetical protein Ddc_13809 [Ditylenchus destructor]|nr:hypothetical protein Ddc_13809 [Ditylenchus destructor]
MSSADSSQVLADSKGEATLDAFNAEQKQLLKVCREKLDELDDDFPRRKHGVRSKEYKSGKHMIFHLFEKLRPGDVLEFAMGHGLKHYGLIVAIRRNEEKIGKLKACEIIVAGKYGGPRAPSRGIKNGVIRLQKLYDIKSKCRLNTLIQNHMSTQGKKMRKVKETVQMALSQVDIAQHYDLIKANCGAWVNEMTYVDFKQSLQADLFARVKIGKTFKNVYP